MSERFRNLRRGVRLYEATFRNELAEQWRERLASEDGQALVEGLEAHGISVRFAYEEGSTKEGNPYKSLNLLVGRFDRPITDEDRSTLRETFPVDKVFFWGHFPETIRPLGAEWQVLYTSPSKDKPEVPPQLKQEVEETLAPHIDKDVPSDHIFIANTAAALNAASGGEITQGMVQERFDFADRLWNMRASGFYRVIDCDMDDLSNPLISGEYETMEEALELVKAQIENERKTRLEGYQEVQQGYTPGSKEWNWYQEDIEKIQNGEPITSSILYIYGPDGKVSGKFFV